ncbi:hypothetical protein LS73_006990 [Helicobacter muridarum]|uniref:Periplasmic protein n=1 Tax=Helicobacter muridarum TaxID=216 RepID=A0A377PWJ0_9HELI|nr:hypothetical protein [Helicobacter muridarum]TLD99607.1 hypothetical protein LS73_006990 [Helicobacter muridarum]STQ86782.1 Uncharacterised protein [Helicobacter muridarum]
MTMRLKCLGLILFFAISYALDQDDSLPVHQELKIKLYEMLYQDKMGNLENPKEKQDFIRPFIQSHDGEEIYRFPNKNIDDVYRAYNFIHEHDNFGPSILHKELPKTNKAFRKDSTSNIPGYVLIYTWKGDNYLEITNVRLQGDELCGKEILEFRSDDKQTTLTTSLEQYCF